MVKLSNVNKFYNEETHAVKNINLSIKEGEFIVFVGPSGCGKSTTLRMIAGLEEVSSGEVMIDGKVVNDTHPKDRDIAMVFQNYALYPHLNVYGNMAFGLKMRKENKREIKKKVEHAASLLNIEALLDRKPKELSGGQRQRVALGRAIVRNAKVFLMDEPLSNLDAKLRAQMRTEIIKLHKSLHTTTIYVTHDQTEAMTMASRIVVLKDGEIQQIGTPAEIYESPVNIFVGEFIGSPKMNILKGKLSGHDFIIHDKAIRLPSPTIRKLKKLGYQDKKIVMGIRPKDFVLTNEASDTTIEATNELLEFTGTEHVLHVNFNGNLLQAKIDSNKQRIGQSVLLDINVEHVHLFDAETEARIEVG